MLSLAMSSLWTLGNLLLWALVAAAGVGLLRYSKSAGRAMIAGAALLGLADLIGGISSAAVALAFQFANAPLPFLWLSRAVSLLTLPLVMGGWASLILAAVRWRR